jgi:lycopene cyclase domain-containing protein
LIVLGLCLAAVLPLEFVLGARVLRDPRRLLRAVVLPVVAFVVWDVVAIERETWRYNPRYVTGWKLPLGLPVEELLFFVVIPLCGLLSYEAVQRILRGRRG